MGTAAAVTFLPARSSGCRTEKMGRLNDVEGWEDGYASANPPSDSPREWRRHSSSCGVRHLVWAMGGLLQLVSVGIQIGLPALLARAESQLLGAAFLAALALLQVPAGWLVDQIGPSLAIVGLLALSAIVLAVIPDDTIGLPHVLVLGGAQAVVAPALALLLANWARSPSERDCALFCKAVGSAAARFGVWQLLATSAFSTSLRWLGAAAGISGGIWLVAGASTPTQWGGAPLSWLLPLTVSDLHALPPLSASEKAAKEKQEREQRQKAQLAKQQTGTTGAAAKYARKMDKRSGDAYNEHKAKADAKKAVAAAAKADKAAAAGKASGDRNAGETTERRTACPSLLSRTRPADSLSILPCSRGRPQLFTCLRRQEGSANAGACGRNRSVATTRWRSRNPRAVSACLQCRNTSCSAATAATVAESGAGAVAAVAATVAAAAGGGG